MAQPFYGNIFNFDMIEFKNRFWRGLSGYLAHLRPHVRYGEFIIALKLKTIKSELKITITFLVLPESGVDMEDIGGCSEILAQIEDDVIFPLLIQASNITIPSTYYGPPKGCQIYFLNFLSLLLKGILLHGPPGCGKTLIARAIAKKAKANFLNFDISILNG